MNSSLSFERKKRPSNQSFIARIIHQAFERKTLVDKVSLPENVHSFISLNVHFILLWRPICGFNLRLPLEKPSHKRNGSLSANIIHNLCHTTYSNRQSACTANCSSEKMAGKHSLLSCTQAGLTVDWHLIFPHCRGGHGRD